MKFIKILLQTFLTLAFFSCQKDINIDAPNSTVIGQLYIEGILYPDKLPKIYISRILPFFDESVTPQEVFARGAVVRIISGEDEQQLEPDSTYDKFRCRWQPFYKGNLPINHGKTYELVINYEGKTYTAETTIDQPKTEIESIEYIAEFFDVYGGHDGVVVKFKDIEGEGNNYRFQMDRWITNDVKHAHILDVIQSECTDPDELFYVKDLGRTIFSDNGADGQSIEVPIEVTFEYKKGDSAWVYIQSLDQNSAIFYQELDQQLESILNPFVEPVFLNSKIDGAIGVFGSAVFSDPILFIYPVDGD